MSDNQPTPGRRRADRHPENATWRREHVVFVLGGMVATAAVIIHVYLVFAG